MFTGITGFTNHYCILCDAPTPSIDICPGCMNDLPWLPFHCDYCALPLPVDNNICESCRHHPPVFSAAFCGFEYRFPVNVLIQRFKNQRQLAVGQVLATLTWQSISAELNTCLQGDELVTAVPLHWTRQRQRGFNQSLMIASTIAARLNLRCETLLNCRKRTSPQKSLGLPARVRNQKALYNLNKPLGGERIILVDDVVTTGSTANAVARCLLAGGAGDVVVVALARTPSAPPQGLC